MGEWVNGRMVMRHLGDLIHETFSEAISGQERLIIHVL